VVKALGRYGNKGDNRYVAINLMRACCNVALGSDDVKSKFVAEAPSIFKVLKNFPDNPWVLQKGYQTIQRLAHKNKGHAKKLIANHAIQLVMKGLENSRNVIVAQALRVLTNMWWGSDGEYDMDFIDAGIIEAVVALINKKHPPTSPEVLGRGEQPVFCEH